MNESHLAQKIVASLNEILTRVARENLPKNVVANVMAKYTPIATNHVQTLKAKFKVINK